MPDPLIIGVDIGGTKVAAGVVDSAGNISHSTRVPMSTASAADGLRAVRSAIDSVCESSSVNPTAIGICAPGPLDQRTGVILNPPNLPAWRNFPLAAEIAKAYSLPVKIDNDGNAAALAEALWGAGREYRNVFYATIGTGIGSGIIFDRRIYHGRTGAAAEGGHVTIDYRGPRCPCGKFGCIEIYASGPSIARRVSERIHAGAKSEVLSAAPGHSITGEDVARAYAADDAIVIAVLQETAMLLAVWLGDIIELIEPDVMIIGGGAASLIRPFFPDILRQIPAWTLNRRSNEIPLVPAYYGADAGIAGAAAMCR